MAQIFPKHRFERSEAVSLDPLNENLRDVVGEANGNLGEHNWASDTFTNARTDVSAVCRVHYKYIEGARSFSHTAEIGPNSYTRFPSTDPFSLEHGHAKIPANRSWTDLLRLDIEVRSSLLWVMASFQQGYQDTKTKSSFPALDRDRFLPGATYALAIDGARIHETTIGGLDRSNDRRGESYRYWNHPFAMDMLYPVSAGAHVISIQGRMVATTDYKEFDEINQFYALGNRELIVLEIT